ncbi:hypothetical protein C5167_016474 [Papaver somniferum]|nr:hypothetical protein C5167_016474 [Papaver somniferum]
MAAHHYHRVGVNGLELHRKEKFSSYKVYVVEGKMKVIVERRNCWKKSGVETVKLLKHKPTDNGGGCWLWTVKVAGSGVDAHKVDCPQGSGNSPTQKSSICYAIYDAEGNFTYFIEKTLGAQDTFTIHRYLPDGSYEDRGVDEVIVEYSWKRQVGGDWLVDQSGAPAITLSAIFFIFIMSILALSSVQILSARPLGGGKNGATMEDILIQNFPYRTPNN